MYKVGYLSTIWLFLNVIPANVRHVLMIKPVRVAKFSMKILGLNVNIVSKDTMKV